VSVSLCKEGYSGDGLLQIEDEADRHSLLFRPRGKFYHL
jgi:hypothetical protein